jgi:hypothetical protein
VTSFKVLFWHLPGGTEEDPQNLFQHSRSQGRDLNPVHYEYEARMLTTRPRGSVTRQGAMNTWTWSNGGWWLARENQRSRRKVGFSATTFCLKLNRDWILIFVMKRLRQMTLPLHDQPKYQTTHPVSHNSFPSSRKIFVLHLVCSDSESSRLKVYDETNVYIFLCGEERAQDA